MVKFGIFLAVLCVLDFEYHLISAAKENSGQGCPDVCQLPEDSGKCWFMIPRWYFDNATKKCANFKYGGCMGNGNRFRSENSCLAHCKSCQNPDVPGTPQAENLAKLKHFKRCMGNHGLGELIVDLLSNGAKYAVFNHQWNLRLPKVYPLAYFTPMSTSDVQYGVKCGSKARIPLTTKSGGHSYESFCYGNADKIVVDFHNMDRVELISGTDTANVGPGANVGKVNTILGQNGYGMSMGQCQTVGIGGHVLGGGTGFVSNVFGLATDNILELTMVDATGNVHVANVEKNRDLYWALRGIGAGYIGIVTDFKFRVYKTAKMKMTVARLQYELEQIVDILESWQNWLEWVNTNEPKIGSMMFMSGKESQSPLSPYGHSVDLLAIHVQYEDIQPKNNTDFIQSIRRIFPTNGNVSITTPTFMEMVRKFSYTPVVNWTPDIDWGTLKNRVALPRYMKQKSFFINKSFGRDQLQKFGDVIRRVPPRFTRLLFATEGGAIRATSRNATSYVHRTSTYSMEEQYEGVPYPAVVAESLKWMEDLWETSQFMDNGETYQNYVDLEVEDWLPRFYAENLDRLLAIKSKYDPTNYFQDPMSLPVRRSRHR